MYSSMSLGLLPADWMRVGCGIRVGMGLRAILLAVYFLDQIQGFDDCVVKSWANLFDRLIRAVGPSAVG